MWKSGLLLLLFVASLTAGCDTIAEIATDDSPISPPSTPCETAPPREDTAAVETPPGRATPSSSPITATPSFEMTDIVSRAINDLATRLGVSPDQVEVLSITPDEFPASNLGCGEYGEQPDRPIPALVTGQRIVLEARGRSYVYHTHGPQVVYCGPLEE